jgi:DNA-binding NarL/FixJ family response regulator
MRTVGRETALPTALLVGFEGPYGDWLAAQLAGSGKLAVLGQSIECSSAAAAIALHRPDAAIVCDEALDTVGLARLARCDPTTGVVVIARRLTAARIRVLDACDVGAMFQRKIDRALLALTVGAVARGIRGGIYLTPTTTDGRAPGHPGFGSLSRREEVVLELLREHRQLGEIAEALGVGRATIDSQAKSIYRKLGISGRSCRDELRCLLTSLDAGEPESGSAAAASAA